MDGMTLQQPVGEAGKTAAARGSAKTPTRLKEHIVEIISDSGEGAQKCGQSLGSIAAQMGNGIWTTEIIPAEIRPPARSVAGASGNRIRIGSGPITNGGDKTDLVVSFNEQVLLGRVRANELKPGCIILLESMWRTHKDAAIAASYVETYSRLVAAGYRVHEVPMEQACRSLTSMDPKRGKNMFALGMLCQLYSLDLKLAADQIVLAFGKKDRSIVDNNIKLLEGGAVWAKEHLDFCFSIPAVRSTEPQVVVNGNTALALGVLASGMEICAMYPITPATSASHYLAEVFEKVGGVVHQAEDEIAACAFAVGASYAGKCAITITSGPGLLPQAGGDRPRRDGRNPAGGGQRAARRPQHRPADQDGAGRPDDDHLRQPRRRAQDRAGARHHRGVLLLRDHGAPDRGNLQHGRRHPDRRRPRDLAAALPAAGVQRELDGAAGRPEPGARGRQALRLGRDHGPVAPVQARPARRHAHAHRPGARQRQPRGLRRRRSTSRRCASAASSWPHSRRR